MTDHPARERMSAHLGIRVPLATMERLTTTADQLGVSLSDVARLAIDHGLPAAHDEIVEGIERGQRGETIA